MAKSYEISESQLLEIETARKKNRNKNVERRLYVLVMRAEGKSLEEISEKTGYHISTASKLIARYMRDGISAIAENHYKGNRRNMSFEEEAAILAPFIEIAERGEMVDIKEIAAAYVDLKKYDPDMRHLIDTYLSADPSRVLTSFGGATLVELLVDNGISALKDMPASTPKEQEAVAETIENNIGKEIVERTQSNPKYYEKMSALLRELIEKRKNDVINYEEYLRQIVELARKVHKPESGTEYPPLREFGRVPLSEPFMTILTGIRLWPIRYITLSCPANRTISGEAKSKSVKSGVLFVLS